MKVTVFVSAPDGLDDLIARYRAAETKFPVIARRTPDRYSRLAMQVARGKALALPSKAPVDRGTRARLSRGVGRRPTRHGYRVTTSMPGMTWYPRAIQGSWSHPVFGSQFEVIQRENWDWFIGPIGSLHDEMRAAVAEDVKDMAHWLGGN